MRFALFLLLLASPLRAQGDSVGPMFMLSIAEPRMAQQAWEYDLACSHVTPSLGGELRNVKWYVADLRAHSAKHNLVGVWLPPDTIILDLSVANDTLVVAHELLHHLLRGPPFPNKHPTIPFVIPCHLFDPKWEEQPK